MRVDLALLWGSLPFLAQGAAVSALIAAAAVALGAAIGLALALGRSYGPAPVRWLCRGYTDCIRGTPLLVQVYIIYFGLPSIGLQLPKGVSGVLALGLNSGAYLGEIFRAGIESISSGQTDAAKSLGMTHGQSLRLVILPQALRRVLPPLGNEVVTLVKDSSLVSVIGLSELLYRGYLVAARTYDYFTLFIGVAAVYFCLTFLVSQAFLSVERRVRLR